MAEHLEHDVTMQPVRIVEEDKTRVFALDLAVRTVHGKVGEEGTSLPYESYTDQVIKVAERYLAWLKPTERPQDQ